MFRATVLLLIFGVVACNKDLVCPQGQADCSGRCVDIREDHANCGGCGVACGTYETCNAGACVACEAGECPAADAYVACYWTNEVKPRSRSLGWAGPPIDLGRARPATLTVADGKLYIGSGQPQASLSIVPLAGGASSSVPLPGYDLNTVKVHGDAVLITNSAEGTLEILARDGTVLDEIPMPDQQNYPNPHGFAVVGSTAYVALNSAQKLAKVDLSSLAACAAPDPEAPACGQNSACAAGRHCVDGICKLRCGSVSGTIDLTAVPDATDGNGLPLPSAVVTDGSRVFVTLANLAWGHVTCDGFSYDWFSVPAGPGRVAIVDPASDDAVSVVNLGEGCKSPSGLALRGSALWVSCGAYCFTDVAPGALVEVDLTDSGATASAPLPLGDTVGGKIAFCAGNGYVTDQRKTGAVVAFDPSTGTTTAPVAICGADANGNALAADFVCTE